MKQKINNLMNQLSVNELDDLFVHIKRQYAVEEKDSMLRDDIRDKVVELLQATFSWITVVDEDTDYFSLALGSQEIVEFCVVLLENFELEHVELAKMMEWQTVKDIVDYIEDNLEQSEPEA